MSDIVFYNFLYMKIKDNSKTEIINLRDLKEIVGRIVIRKGGIPRFMVKYIIGDLIILGLLERIRFNEYKIVESNCDKKIRQLLSYY